MPKTQFPAQIELSSLNGLNGFTLIGPSSSERSGYSVAGGKDVNGDGLPDLIIGAPIASRSGSGINAGQSYVLFGSHNQTAWGSGILNLDTLMDGHRGFYILGAVGGDQSGTSVSMADDLNGDGVADLIIGAPNASPGGRSGAGSAFVVFGGLQIGGNGMLDLLTLNGVNGFRLNGVTASDQLGGGRSAVNSLGDINNDGFNDFIVGAALASPGNRTKAGASYVVFGSSQIGKNGTMELSSLNGTNGFVLNGIKGYGYVGPSADNSGASVNTAGDVNHDGIADLIIGAPNASPQGQYLAGSSYVVFGRSGIGRNGTLELSSLNGVNGFTLNGNGGDESGGAVDGGGDINQDGITDLIIGAYNGFDGNTNDLAAGRTYVIFGNAKLSQNSTFNLKNLNGHNGFVVNGNGYGVRSGSSVGHGDMNGDGTPDLIIGAPDNNPGNRTMAGSTYVIFFGTGVGKNGIVQLSSLNGTNGFVLNGVNGSNSGFGRDYSGLSVNGIGDFNGDGLDDLIIGAPFASLGGLWSGSSYVVFGDVAPKLWVNQLTLRDGQTIVFTAQNINATDNGPVIFSITQLQHGRFQYVNSSGKAITNFTQTQISNHQIEFIHDGSGIAPAYWVQVLNSGIALSLPPKLVNVTFTRRLILVKNTLLIHQGEITPITSASLNITDDFLPSQINITVSSLQHGQFTLAPRNQSITRFSQQQLLAGQIFFTADGSATVPSYQVIINDPSAALSPDAANITFYRKPVIHNNHPIIHQGESLRLTTAFLNITDAYPAHQVNFTVSAVQHGQFQLLPLNQSITQFTAQQLQNGQVFFVQDGSASAPSYQLSAHDPYFALPPSPANITFYRQPILLNNRLPIHQGESMLLNASWLAVQDDYPASQVNITASQVQHGQFALLGQNHSITQWTEQQLLSGQVLFVQDNSTGVPSYQLDLRDPYFSLPPSFAQITFYRRPILQQTPFSVHQGQSLLMTPALLNLTDDAALDQVIFTVASLQHGQFVFTPANTSVTLFTEQQLLNGQIELVQDGSVMRPSYQISLSDGYFSIPAKPANIIFYRRPVLMNHLLTVHQGESLIVKPNFFNVSDDYSADQVNFTVSHSQHMQWKLLPTNQTISQFTQQQLQDDQVLLTQDDSAQAPAFQITVNDPYFMLPAVAPNINFYRRPALMNNKITIQERNTTVLSSSSLSVMDDYPPDQVRFMITQLQHGRFELVTAPNSSISQFTQQQIETGQIQLQQDGSELLPKYNISVQDPYFSIGPFAAQVTFIPIYDDIPMLLTNRLTTLQGRTSVLSAADLSALDENPQVDPSTLLFTVKNVQHGFFNKIQNPAIPITQFSQQHINNNEVEFTQDGTGFSPAYEVMVSDGVLSSTVETANITFYAAPLITVNQLNIAPGETVVLSRTNLQVIPNKYTTEAELVVTASNVEYGYFSTTTAASEPITQFTQDAVTNSEIEFTQDGSDQPPAYTLMVTDNNGLTAGPSIAKVTLTTPSAVSGGNSNTVRNAIIGAVISGVVGFGFFACQLWIKHKAASYLERATEEKDGIGKEQAEFYKNVLRPMAKRILGRLKLSGLFGYVSDDTLKDALSAITVLVHELQKQEIEVDLTKLKPIERTRLLDTVARKTRQILVPETKCCSSAWFSRLFCPEVTPVQIEEQAQNIAQAVKLALENSTLLIPSPSLDFKEGAQQISVELQPVKPDTALDQSSDVEINRISDELTASSKNRNSFLVSASELQKSTGVSENLEKRQGF